MLSLPLGIVIAARSELAAVPNTVSGWPRHVEVPLRGRSGGAKRMPSSESRGGDSRSSRHACSFPRWVITSQSLECLRSFEAQKTQQGGVSKFLVCVSLPPLPLQDRAALAVCLLLNVACETAAATTFPAGHISPSAVCRFCTNSESRSPVGFLCACVYAYEVT